jgi:hypothetical protein
VPVESPSPLIANSARASAPREQYTRYAPWEDGTRMVGIRK